MKLEIKPRELLDIRFDAGVGSIPIGLNHNDKNTLFAGSIFSGAVLTGYYAASNIFKDMGVEGDLVAKKSEIQYLLPIYTDATTHLVSNNEPRLKPSGNYELECEVDVRNEQGQKCACLQTSFIFVVKP